MIGTKGKSRIATEKDMAAALHKIIADRDHHAKLREGALKRAEHFSYDNGVRDLVDRFYTAH